MQEIDIRRTRAARLLVQVDVLEAGDARIDTGIDHIYNSTWEWGSTNRWEAFYPRWPYLFTFSDGTRGVCREGRLGAALRALDFETIPQEVTR